MVVAYVVIISILVFNLFMLVEDHHGMALEKQRKYKELAHEHRKFKLRFRH